MRGIVVGVVEEEYFFKVQEHHGRIIVPRNAVCRERPIVASMCRTQTSCWFLM